MDRTLTNRTIVGTSFGELKALRRDGQLNGTQLNGTQARLLSLGEEMEVRERRLWGATRIFSISPSSGSRCCSVHRGRRSGPTPGSISICARGTLNSGSSAFRAVN